MLTSALIRTVEVEDRRFHRMNHMAWWDCFDEPGHIPGDSKDIAPTGVWMCGHGPSNRTQLRLVFGCRSVLSS